MDAIKKLDGLQIRAQDGSIQFGCAAAACNFQIDDPDFSARFDGVKWTVKWNWSAEEPSLSNRIACYGVDPSIKDEVLTWY